MPRKQATIIPKVRRAIKPPKRNDGSIIEVINEGKGEKRLVVMPTDEPWKRIDGEPDAAYGYFVQWLNTGSRGMRPTMEKFAEQFDVKASTIKGYSASWLWRARANAYDTHFESIQQERDEAARRRIKNRALHLAEMGLTELEKVLPEIIEEAKSQIRPVAEQHYLDEGGVVRVDVRVTLDPKLIKDWANAVAILNREAYTAVGLPSSISSSSVKIGPDAESFEDVIRQLEDRRQFKLPSVIENPREDDNE